MNQKKAGDITFQLTVGQLTFSSQLIKQNIHVTVSVGDLSKITCSGELAEDGLAITWNHPFLFTAPSSTAIVVAIVNLPEELTLQWNKNPLGDQVVTDVASLVKSGKMWKCDVHGLPVDHATLTITCKASDVLIAPNGHDCMSSLKEYSYKLYSFGTKTRNVPCVSTSIEVDLARLDLCPLGHADYTAILNDLSVSLFMCYKQDGNITYLNRDIEIEKIRLSLCPLGHPEHAKALEGLTMSLWDHYCIQKNKNDLNMLMKMQERWLNMCPLGHSKHAKALGQYAKSLWEYYNVHGNLADLNRAIEMQEKRLDLCPAGHPDHAAALANLAASLNTCYRKQGNILDLNRAIDLTEQNLTLRPSNHPDHGTNLSNLAVLLWDHYRKTGNHSDLSRTIVLLKEVLQIYPVYHRHYASDAAKLAAATLLLPNSPQADGVPSSVDEAFETYRLLKRCGPAASLDLWKATQDWVYNAEKYNHSSVLEAYQTSLNTLGHFTTLSSSLDSRHETMQAGVTNLANNAFSCATRHGEFQMSVELLEQGRGILWNQLSRFDISIAALEAQGSQGQELGKKFTRLSVDLRKHAQGNCGAKDTSPYWRAQEQWQSVVDEIRHLDGFSRFLLPPCFEDLQGAAECGPVIIVNASKYTCDALIILHSHSPVHVPLPCSLADVKELCSQLSVLTRNAHAYAQHRESYVKHVLRELWSSVVRPISSVLQNDVQLPFGSRIWWCPTSKFTTLPLHAAGPYQKGEKNFLDLYVSSYAPSLSGLIRTRERIRVQKKDQRDPAGTAGRKSFVNLVSSHARSLSGLIRTTRKRERSQKKACDAPGLTNSISFAAVGQARPTADTKLSELVEVDHEIWRIRNETGMPPDVTFETITGEAATIDGAIQAFRDHRWVHVACHGAQHANKPFKSWFAMGDGKLTLKRIIQERYTNSEFAFLSACHTAVGDASTPDEVLHLAAGMQFAGFKGVIGTLWKVDDAVAHRFVTRFYKEMFKYPTIDFEHAAVALNTAAVETADEVSLEKRIVFVHIGI